jgi:hypothetical protein
MNIRFRMLIPLFVVVVVVAAMLAASMAAAPTVRSDSPIKNKG